MPWSKGAVVIKKSGDEEWANEMEKVLDIPREDDKDREALKRDNEWMKRHIVEELEQKIIDAEIDYGYNFVPPKWLKPVISMVALIEYGEAMFVDKYMKIHGEE
jgi:hypothetical protein